MALAAWLAVAVTSPLSAARGAACGRREFWIVNTRHAPLCKGLDKGLDKITYWKCERGRGWVRHSLDEFLAAVEPSLPTTFYVHGNTLDNEQAIQGARQVYDRIGRGVPSFRLVLWSWPAEHIKGMSAIDNILVKARRCESQGYYLAWLVDRLDPQVPISLAGHSFGARTVTAALQGLAADRIAGYELPERKYQGRRPMQAALVAAAMDNTLLLPGYRHGLALTQVDRMLITKNPQDRSLRLFSLLSETGVDALGTTGIPGLARLPDRNKVRQLVPSRWVGKAHRWSRYTNSPGAAASLRPYFFYQDAAPLGDVGPPAATH